MLPWATAAGSAVTIQRTCPAPRERGDFSTGVAAADARHCREYERDAPPRALHDGGTDPVAKVTMPQLGESVAEGTIGRWLKQPGDTVAKYEPLLEVITDKVNAEVPSPFAGVLKEILAQEGDTVPNNAEIAVIETEDEALSGGTEAPARARAGQRPGRLRRATGGRAGRRVGGRRGPRPPPVAPVPAAPVRPRRPRSRRRRTPLPPSTADARSQRPHDPGRSTPAPRARARGVAGAPAPAAVGGSPARTSSPSSRRSAPGTAVAGAGGIGAFGARRPAVSRARLPRPTPASRSPPARTRSSSR